MLDLPRVYHGLVSRSCLDSLRRAAGSCFPGPSPDISNAVGLAFFVRNFVMTDLPLVISGHCSESTGGQGARHAHHGEVSDIPFLPQNISEIWPLEVPFFWSGPTIYAASVYLALKAVGRQDLSSRIDRSRLYAFCLVFHHDYADRVVPHIKNMRGSTDQLKIAREMIAILYLRLQSLATNIGFRLRLRTRQESRQSAIEDIRAAMDSVEKKSAAHFSTVRSCVASKTWIY